jgi:hypothetical protein
MLSPKSFKRKEALEFTLSKACFSGSNFHWPRADNDFRAVDYFAAVTEKTLGFPATSVKR